MLEFTHQEFISILRIEKKHHVILIINYGIGQLSLPSAVQLINLRITLNNVRDKVSAYSVPTSCPTRRVE